MSKQEFETAASRKIAVEALKKFKQGEIDKLELARVTGRLPKYYWQQRADGLLNCIAVTDALGWFNQQHPEIKNLQGIKEQDLPVFACPHTVFTLSRK